LSWAEGAKKTLAKKATAKPALKKAVAKKPASQKLPAKPLSAKTARQTAGKTAEKPAVAAVKRTLSSNNRSTGKKMATDAASKKATVSSPKTSGRRVSKPQPALQQ